MLDSEPDGPVGPAVEPVEGAGRHGGLLTRPEDELPPADVDV